MSQTAVIDPTGHIQFTNAVLIRNFADDQVTVCKSHCESLNLIYPQYVEYCTELCENFENLDKCNSGCSGLSDGQTEFCNIACDIAEAFLVEDVLDNALEFAFDFLNNADIVDKDGNIVDFSDIDIEDFTEYLDQSLEFVFEEGIEFLKDIFDLREESLEKLFDANEADLSITKDCLSNCSQYGYEARKGLWSQCGNECAESLGRSSIGLSDAGAVTPSVVGVATLSLIAALF